MMENLSVLDLALSGVKGLSAYKTLPFEMSNMTGELFSFQSPILNIDIAPTIVELAGGKAPESMDGQSILPLLVGAVTFVGSFLLSVYLCCVG